MLTGFGALATGVAARRADGVVVDLSHLGDAYRRPDLMAVLAAGPAEWERMRDAVDSAPVADLAVGAPLVPIRPGDYVDCYACEFHAANVGRRFRPGQPPLPAAWPHAPLAYHGRASTVVVSGSPVYRPWGIRARSCGAPTYGPSQRLDVEVELGFVVGIGNDRGRPVPARDAEAHLFGVVVLNDWSARDIQAFETVPLGPFVGKSFCTSISPWVVPLDLVPRVPVSALGTAPHLVDRSALGLDLDLTLAIDDVVISRTNARHLAWTPAQLLAQITVGGASTRPGDLIGSGTISGPSSGSEGSLLEIDGPFLDDGQRVTIASEAIGAVEGRIERCRTTEP